ncbi:Chondroitin proteoglycan-2 like protein [Argiope bruennichi]|uniref:Chondroitin proteoglycan-2 like protein n=1 Tax=Argiope bruennichi TaxID=94029 RepID=A0A8T0EAR4_ARGBR|nr:Chondroitin proteoglycan-2 like protein [Argiope bruennichi]
MKKHSNFAEAVMDGKPVPLVFRAFKLDVILIAGNRLFAVMLQRSNAQSGSVPEPLFVKGCRAQRGQFPHETYCQQYYNCWDGRATIEECPGKLLFNPVISACDFPEAVNCLARLRNPEPAITSDGRCLKQFGIFPDPTDCTAFYECSHGRSFRQVCPYYTAFDERYLVCVHAYDVECGGRGGIYGTLAPPIFSIPDRGISAQIGLPPPPPLGSSGSASGWDRRGSASSGFGSQSPPPIKGTSHGTGIRRSGASTSPSAGSTIPIGGRPDTSIATESHGAIGSTRGEIHGSRSDGFGGDFQGSSVSGGDGRRAPSGTDNRISNDGAIGSGIRAGAGSSNIPGSNQQAGAASSGASGSGTRGGAASSGSGGSGVRGGAGGSGIGAPGSQSGAGGSGGSGTRSGAGSVLGGSGGSNAGGSGTRGGAGGSGVGGRPGGAGRGVGGNRGAAGTGGGSRSGASGSDGVGSGNRGSGGSAGTGTGSRGPGTSGSGSRGSVGSGAGSRGSGGSGAGTGSRAPSGGRGGNRGGSGGSSGISGSTSSSVGGGNRPSSSGTAGDGSSSRIESIGSVGSSGGSHAGITGIVDKEISPTGQERQYEQPISPEATFRCPQPRGLYPNALDCTRFWLCREYKPSLLKCPTGQLFDLNSLSCVNPEKAQCSSISPRT